MAAELQISFLGIMHFNKKTDVTNALLRISDSLAYGATARHVYAAIDDAENKRKLFVKAKNNLAKYDQQSLAYHFGAKKVGFDEKLKEEIWAPYIEWEPQPVVITATEAMESATSSRAPKERTSAMKFLAEFLADGPKFADDITEAAKANLISDATLRRAKEELEIIAEKEKGVPTGDGCGACLSELRGIGRTTKGVPARCVSRLSAFERLGPFRVLIYIYSFVKSMTYTV